MRSRRLDPLDERILRVLVRNARATWREVGDEVGLSANAVAQRVRRLQEQGVVRGWTTLLDPALEDDAPHALVLLRTSTAVDPAAVEAAMIAVPAVEEVLDLAGPWDYQVRVRYGDQAALYDTVNVLRAVPGVTAIETRAVLREVLGRRATSP